MGWSIGWIDNTLHIPDECGKELEELGGEWDGLDLEGYSPRLRFNSDHMEHMDCMWREDVQEILARHKVNGRVTFGSLEGDNAREFWGYEWKDGVIHELSGHIEWTPVESES